MALNDPRLTIGITTDMDFGVQHVQKGYMRALREIGAQPLVIRHETPAEELERMAERMDGMLFSGGADVDPSSYAAERSPACGLTHPMRDALEKRMLQICLERGIPVLGICRGCQMINAALGGTLVQDIPLRYGRSHQMPKGAPSAFDHDVRVVRGTLLHEIMNGDLRVDSYHHQCVERLAQGLIPSAYAPEGFVEAFEFPPSRSFLMAVQWHPEVSLDADMYSARIFRRFRDACAAYRSGRTGL